MSWEGGPSHPRFSISQACEEGTLLEHWGSHGAVCVQARILDHLFKGHIESEMRSTNQHGEGGRLAGRQVVPRASARCIQVSYSVPRGRGGAGSSCVHWGRWQSPPLVGIGQREAGMRQIRKWPRRQKYVQGHTASSVVLTDARCAEQQAKGICRSLPFPGLVLLGGTGHPQGRDGLCFEATHRRPSSSLLLPAPQQPDHRAAPQSLCHHGCLRDGLQAALCH